jgi:hypothetical protein
MSRSGARCWDCSRSVSPDLSPNPPCAFPRNGLSTVHAVRLLQQPRGWGSCCRGSGTGLPGSPPSAATRSGPAAAALFDQLESRAGALKTLTVGALRGTEMILVPHQTLGGILTRFDRQNHDPAVSC